MTRSIDCAPPFDAIGALAHLRFSLSPPSFTVGWARRNGEEGAYHLSFDVKTEGRIITDAWLRVHTTTGGGRDGCNVEVNPTRERLDLRTNRISPRTRGRENWIEFGVVGDGVGVGVGDFSTEMLHLNLTIRNCTIEAAEEEPPFLLVSSTVTGEPLSPPSLPKKRRLRRRSTSNRNATCTLRPMTINFNRLGWKEWILAPGSYSAGVCQGSCPIRGPYDNFHAHATVVALMRIKGAEVMFGSPVCVAVGRYDSLAVLVAEKGKVSKLKTFKQMIVQHCGCR